MEINWNWVSLYLLVGVIYTLFRFWEEETFKKMMDEINNAPFSPEIIKMAFPVVMVLAVLTWPIHITRMIVRKLKGE